MIRKPDVEGLRCTACGRASLRREDGSRICCADCHAIVLVEEGIPILVRDWAAVAADVEAARRVRPLWYQDEQSPEQASPWRHHLRKRRQYVARAIARHLARTGQSKVDRLLDMGCGDGQNLVWLSEFADRSYGSDYNLVRLVRAAALNPGATIFAADVLDFPADADLFDLVFFNHVIEHIPDDLATLAEVRRILKPGGLLILGTPNEGAWWWQWAYRRDPATLKGTDHCHFYTALTIGAKLLKSDFDVIETYHLGWGPPDWNLDGRIRKYRVVDDTFTIIGRALLPRQASSLYLLATKRREG